MDNTGSERKSVLEKTEKRIVILDSCQFTVQGLALLCERHSGWRICGKASSLPQLLKLLSRQRVDMVLCGIGKRAEEFSQLLNLPTRLRGSCILLTDKRSAVLRAAFLTAGFDAVVSKQTLLTALDSLIYYTLYLTRRTIRMNKQATCYRPLEREVLSALLEGKTPHHIANEMGVSYRTVSRYKQNGLKRAGLRSLNEILACQREYVSKKTN